MTPSELPAEPEYLRHLGRTPANTSTSGRPVREVLTRALERSRFANPDGDALALPPGGS